MKWTWIETVASDSTFAANKVLSLLMCLNIFVYLFHLRIKYLQNRLIVISFIRSQLLFHFIPLLFHLCSFSVLVGWIIIYIYTAIYLYHPFETLISFPLGAHPNQVMQPMRPMHGSDIHFLFKTQDICTLIPIII